MTSISRTPLLLCESESWHASSCQLLCGQSHSNVSQAYIILIELFVNDLTGSLGRLEALSGRSLQTLSRGYERWLHISLGFQLIMHLVGV